MLHLQKTKFINFMKSLKSSFSLLFICFIFNIGKSQSIEKTQIDNIFFELVLKDMGKDKNIDNFCDNSILSEIHSLRIDLQATTFKNKNKSMPDDFLSLDISPRFSLGWNTGGEGKVYLIKKDKFKTKKPKWDHCNTVYYDKFLSELTYEDFINQKWDFLSSMKNLKSLVIYVNGSCEANLNNFTIFSNNTLNLKDLMNLEELALNGTTDINRNLNEIIVFGNNNKLKDITNITYRQFSSLSNSSNLKNIRTVIFSHPIDTLLKIKRINKIENLYLNISKNIVKNDTLMLDESFPLLDFVDTVNSLFLTTQIDFKRTTQFNLIFRNNTVINLLNLEGFKNDLYRIKSLFTLNIDISRYKHFLKFSDFQHPYGDYDGTTQRYYNYFIPIKLKLSLNTFQLENYKNPNNLFPKIKESSANIPTTDWFEINHIKTESEKNAELEQIKIQKEIKRKEEEFNNSLLSKKYDSEIKSIFDKIIIQVVALNLVAKDVEKLILNQNDKLGESIGHKLTEDESKYFYKRIEEYAAEYQKQIDLYNLLYSN